VKLPLAVKLPLRFDVSTISLVCLLPWDKSTTRDIGRTLLENPGDIAETLRGADQKFV